MTNEDYLFLTRRARIERRAREVCAGIREALKPRQITKQQITDMVKAELVAALDLKPGRTYTPAELTRRAKAYADPAPRRNENAPDGEEELLTVCLDGMKIYKRWENGIAYYRTEYSGGNEE